MRAIFVGFVALLVLTLGLGFVALMRPSPQTNLGAQLEKLDSLESPADIAALVEDLPQEVGGLPLLESNAQPFPVEGGQDALVGQINYGNQGLGVTLGVIGTVDEQFTRGRHVLSLLTVSAGPESMCREGTVRGTGLTPRSSMADFNQDARAEGDVPLWVSCDLIVDRFSGQARPAAAWSDGSSLWLIQATNESLFDAMVDALLDVQKA